MTGSIQYQTHIQNIGWLGWAANGQDVGTSGYSYRLEGMQIVLVPKGQPAPGSTVNPSHTKVDKPVEKPGFKPSTPTEGGVGIPGMGGATDIFDNLYG